MGATAAAIATALNTTQWSTVRIAFTVVGRRRACTAQYMPSQNVLRHQLLPTQRASLGVGTSASRPGIPRYLWCIKWWLRKPIAAGKTIEILAKIEPNRLAFAVL